MRSGIRALLSLGLLGVVAGSASAANKPLQPGVRGLVTRASGPVTVDGKLDEWSGAFCTPVAYNHKDPVNRASQFFYLWDDEAFYIGLRALDQKQANPSEGYGLFNGDAVEFYLDTRPGDALGGKDWTQGAIHFYFTAFNKTAVAPRWIMRRGIATSDTVITGVEIVATSTPDSYSMEFKIPWANFPDFKPATGSVLALDAELCFGDGASRTDRTFSYGSPLSVQQPASQGRVQLVDRTSPLDLTASVNASQFPLWVETPWVQPERAKTQAVLAVPPDQIDHVEKATLRIHDLDGKVIDQRPMQPERLGPENLGFVRYVARWPIDAHDPGTFMATAEIILKGTSQPIRVAPRLVQEANVTGR